MPLSDTQRRAIAQIQAAGEMTFYDYLFHIGDAVLRYDTAGALIRQGYLEPDAEANDAEAHDLPLRVVHYRLTGKHEESERRMPENQEQPTPRHETSRLSIDDDGSNMGFYVIKIHHPLYENGEQVLTTLQPGEIQELHFLLGAWLDAHRQQQEAASHDN